jgi:hypothetical protein
MRDKGNPDSAVSARETTPSDPPGRWKGRSRNSRPRHPLILQVTQTDDPKKYLWPFASLDPSTARNPATPPSDPSGYSNSRRQKVGNSTLWNFGSPKRSSARNPTVDPSLIFRTVDSKKTAHETLWSFGSLERSTVKKPRTRSSDPSGHWNVRQRQPRPRQPLIRRVIGPVYRGKLGLSATKTPPSIYRSLHKHIDLNTATGDPPKSWAKIWQIIFLTWKKKLTSKCKKTIKEKNHLIKKSRIL